MRHRYVDDEPNPYAAPCAYGCSQRDKHKPTNPDGTPQCPGDNCRGCLPRPAEHGTLCPTCWTRLNGDIVDTPDLLAHLRHIGRPNAGHQAGGDGRNTGDPAKRTIIPAAWLDEDEIANELTSWAHVIIETHPATLTGPQGLRWVNGGTAGGPYTGETWHVDPRPVGVHTPDPLITWLLPLLPWAVEQEWAAEMRRAVSNLIGTAKARWPITERGHHVIGIPCPRCDTVALWYSPPTLERPTMQVHCTNDECGRTFPEDEWDRLRSLITIAAERGLIA